ncbi:MAG: hypothetical protein ACP5NW_01930 [Candidatus Woesearchaeota archaeon]
MGLMDFLKKKSDGVGSDELGLDSGEIGQDTLGLSSMNNMNKGMEFQTDLNPSMNISTMNNSAFGHTSMQPMQQESDIQKDIQVISLKLDAIKSELDAMNQRMKNLEMIAEREQSKTNKKWY